MFWKKKEPKPTPKPAPYCPSEFASNVLRLMRRHPHDWSYRWQHNAEVYAITLAKDGDDIMVHLDTGDTFTIHSGTTIKGNEPSKGTLPVPLDDKDKALIVKAAREVCIKKSNKLASDKEIDLIKKKNT